MIENKHPKNSGTRVLFNHPLLEKLSRTHVSVPIVIFLSYAAVLLAWSIRTTSLDAPQTAAMFFVGILSFSWIEYLTHRYVFHMTTGDPVRYKWQYLIHGVHHEFPKDKDRLAMPPLISVTIATLLLFIFRVFLGDLTFSFLPGFLVGYAGYLSVHYMVHAFPPPKNFLKALWINHSIHHYKDGDSAFGVSSPLWDYVYRTLRKSNKDKKPVNNPERPNVNGDIGEEEILFI